MKCNLTSFLAWAAARGISSPLELVVQDNSSYRFMGVSDSDDEDLFLGQMRLSPTEQVDVLTVPFSACIISDTSLGLAEKLAFEKSLGQDSEFADYINVLPTLEDFQTLPRFWGRERREFVAKCDGGQLESRLKLDQVRLDQTEHQWALACVDSRCNILPNSGICLTPMLDMFNHDSRVNTRARINEEDGELVLSVDSQSLTRPQSDAMKTLNPTIREVFISYGELTNIETLCNYGFVEPNDYNVETFVVNLLGQKPLAFTVDSSGSIDNMLNQASFSALFQYIATTYSPKNSQTPTISKKEEMEAWALICGELEEAAYQSSAGAREAKQANDKVVARYLDGRAKTLQTAITTLQERFPELSSM